MKDNLNILVAFPYPSGSGLHVGHFYNYAIIDSYCKYKKYLGNSVFQPFSCDSYGLPAELYAQKIGGNAKEITYQNIDNFKKQMLAMDTQYEWFPNTSDEIYTKSTQKLFTLLKEKDLAFKDFREQDYCPSCKTTLAREQVVEEKCDRCKIKTEKKKLNQWFFRITDYKERLIKDLQTVDYPQKTIRQQTHWLENLTDWCVSRQRKWGCPIPIGNEEDTLDTFVDSSYYFLRYFDAFNEQEIFEKFKPKQYDLYVIGNEHSCQHLIFARFMTKVLFDAGYIDFEEPFKKVIHQGMILKDNQKMSKSLGNTISPDNYDQGHLRFYLMFIGHYFDGGSFNDNNFKGIPRFVNKMKVWLSKVGEEEIDIKEFKKKIFQYTEDFKFNKVVSEWMILLNQNKGKSLTQEQIKDLIGLLQIYIPNFEI